MKLTKPLLITTALMGGMAYANTCETLHNTDPQSAISVCLKELKQSPNDPTLQFYLGYAYYETQNYKKAFEWYTKSAKQGNSNAEVGLGNLYEMGNGVKQDYRKALKWYQKATQQDNAVAQYNMGVMYANGYGVKQDDQTAELWFGKACDNGYQDACEYR